MLNFARLLIIIGLIIILIGSLIFLMARVGIPLGNLPGNIRIQRGSLTCVFALGASIVLSILLTVVLNLMARFLNR